MDVVVIGLGSMGKEEYVCLENEMTCGIYTA